MKDNIDPHKLPGFLNYEKFVKLSNDREVSRWFEQGSNINKERKKQKIPVLGNNPSEAAMNYMRYIEKNSDIKIEAVLEYIKYMHQVEEINDTEDIIDALERERKIRRANKNNIGNRGRPSKVNKASKK